MFMFFGGFPVWKGVDKLGDLSLSIFLKFDGIV